MQGSRPETPMTSPPPPPAAQDREARLAAALRANLKRRKVAEKQGDKTSSSDKKD